MNAKQFFNRKVDNLALVASHLNQAWHALHQHLQFERTATGREDEEVVKLAEVVAQMFNEAESLKDASAELLPVLPAGAEVNP